LNLKFATVFAVGECEFQVQGTRADFSSAPLLLSPGAINNSLTIFGAIVAKSRADRGFLWFPVR